MSPHSILKGRLSFSSRLLPPPLRPRELLSPIRLTLAALGVSGRAMLVISKGPPGYCAKPVACIALDPPSLYILNTVRASFSSTETHTANSPSKPSLQPYLRSQRVRNTNESPSP